MAYRANRSSAASREQGSCRRDCRGGQPSRWGLAFNPWPHAVWAGSPPPTGSDPPSRHASIGIGENRDVHRHPPRRRGSLPASSPHVGRPKQRVAERARPVHARGLPNSPPANGSTAAPTRRSTLFRDGLMLRERPRHEGRGCASTLAAMPYRAFGEGGRSPPRPAWLLLPRPAVRRSRKTLPCRRIRWTSRCASLEPQSVHRPPLSLSHLRPGTRHQASQ